MINVNIHKMSLYFVKLSIKLDKNNFNQEINECKQTFDYLAFTLLVCEGRINKHQSESAKRVNLRRGDCYERGRRSSRIW